MALFNYKMFLFVFFLQITTIRERVLNKFYEPVNRSLEIYDIYSDDGEDPGVKCVCRIYRSTTKLGSTNLS